MIGKIKIEGIFERHDDANRLARILYALRGCQVHEGFDFSQSRHPHETEAYGTAAQLLELFEDPVKATITINGVRYGLTAKATEKPKKETAR